MMMPPDDHVFKPTSTTLLEGHPRTINFLPDYFEIWPVVFDKKIFKVFLLFAMATRILHGIEFFEQLWKGTIQ